ncbi:unnamed protein product [Knipowitschia caucasica]|uniref:RNA polymerase II subunit B1 CTD phosphatase RPAP2 homolog n=1 Tax=Knipowitschia caucasica TaxID=637954 RepID=A0AAV2JNZ5_KNICA
MEQIEEKGNASGISKTSKKSGRKSKGFSEEEEARRREAVKEALREKLDLEKRALQIVERLLEDSVSEDFLIDCAWFITPANYKDAIEERSIVKLCGFPLCPNKLGKIPTQQFKISTKTNKVYDITERKLYCSNFCYKASKQFEMQISTTPLWLRNHESPPQITLMKRGDSGSSGEEIKLSQNRLQEDDVENPSLAQTEEPGKPGAKSVNSDNSDNSDDSDTEQDFVSSVVSAKTGPKEVHWGDLPKYDKTQSTTDCADRKGEINGNDVAVDEATTQLHSCSLSEKTSESNEAEIEGKIKSEPKNDPSRIQDTDDTNINITQVGMSKKGAVGLRNLLKQHGTKADSVRLKLLESLKTTLREWATEETRRVLFGFEGSVGKISGSETKTQKEEEEEEELDEDDLEEEQCGEGGAEEATAAALPDFETLKKETEHMNLRVKEFYRGTWEVAEEQRETRTDTKEPTSEGIEPVLPLVDSKAQHVIQKKIVVDKLSGCLKNLVGRLGLTMNDISSHLNNLVRTFRFSNTNIIHKTPEWAVLAVVLLHLLSAVSSLVREVLEQPSSLQILDSVTQDLGLEETDLLDLVQTFKHTDHTQ